ncbi:DNA recombination protein RmuC [Candidatus Saccharibacteria bacterium]|nr:DNA recombination protein RmuC [Candidatus Saccharibacteria bacterium]
MSQETLMVIVLIAVVVGFAIVVLILNLRLKELRQGSAVELMKTDVTELSRTISMLQQAMGDKLERNNTTMQQSMQKQLGESSRLVAEVTQRLAKLDETNRRVVDVADELKTLQNVLSNPKQRGGLGEYYLDVVLSNVLPPHVYETQYKFKDGQIVDAIIKLDKNRILPIDSKFSLENYNRLIEAKDKVEREAYVKVFKNDIKNRIDETAKYIRPNENTLDYAFMFIPSEAIYYDLLVNNVGSTGTSSRDLIEYAFIDKKVIIVSPTTLLAYLQTVMQGLKSLQIEVQAKDIQKRVGELGKHLQAHETFMQKLGSSLGTTVNHFNTAHKELGKIDKDIVKIADVSPGIEPLIVDKPHSEDQ